MNQNTVEALRALGRSREGGVNRIDRVNIFQRMRRYLPNPVCTTARAVTCIPWLPGAQELLRDISTALVPTTI